MIDVTSTIEGYTNVNDAYIRYANYLCLRVILRSYDNEQIYIPTLTVEYRERPLSVINKGNSIASTSWNVFILNSLLIRLFILWKYHGL